MFFFFCFSFLFLARGRRSFWETRYIGLENIAVTSAQMSWVVGLQGSTGFLSKKWVFLSFYSPPVRLGLLDFSVSSSPLLLFSSPPSFFIFTIIIIILVILITLPIYLITAHVSFSLLATTGAASISQKR